MFLGDHTVAMITYCVTKMITTYPPIGTKHIRRRWRERSLVKNVFLFYFGISHLSSVSVGIDTCRCWICYECVQFQIEIWKISRCASRSLENWQRRIWLISRCCGGRQRILPSIKPWPNRKCFASKHHQTLFGDQTFYHLDTLFGAVWLKAIKHVIKNLN